MKLTILLASLLTCCLIAFGDFAIPAFADSVITIPNSGFETPNEGNGFEYAPANASWAFTALVQTGKIPSGSGVAANGSQFTGSLPAPEGNQNAFLQGKGSISQTLSGFDQSQPYVLTFFAAQRSGSSPQTFRITLGSTILGSFTPVTSRYDQFSVWIPSIAASSEKMTILGLDPEKTDSTAFIDNIQITIPSLSSRQVSFEPPVTVTSADSNTIGSVADVDGDGHQDVIVVGTNEIIVYYGNGDGTFDPVDYPANGVVFQAVAADLTGSGSKDIVFITSGQVGVIKNLGSRTFSAATFYSTGGSGATLFDTGDFNHDGLMDIGIGNNASSNWTELQQDSTGDFNIAQSYGTPQFPADVAIADMDGDGNLDAIVTFSQNPNCLIYFGDGKGGFPRVGGAPVGGGTIVPVDLNGDGHLDLVCSNYWGGDLAVSLNDGTGNFASSTTYPADGYPDGISVGDVNGDGIPDLTLGHSNTPYYSVYLNDSTGKLTLADKLYTSGTGSHLGALADFDEDGQPDIVADGSSGYFSLFINNTNPVPTLLGLNPNGVVTGSAGFNLAVTGPGILSNSAVEWNGSPLSTISYAYLTHTLTIAVPASYVSTAGFQNITVVNAPPYGGTSNVLQLQVGAAVSVALEASVNPAVVGQSVTFTATVAPVSPGASVTGSVSFYDGNALIGYGSLNSGIASVTTNLSSGTHSIIAQYSGDANYLQAPSPSLSETVNPFWTKTTLSSSSSSAIYGDAVTLTATTVAVAPGSGTVNDGTVTFMDGTVQLGQAPMSGGMSSVSISNFSVGSHHIKAEYSGGAIGMDSTSALFVQRVSKATPNATLSSSANPARYGQTVTLMMVASGSGNGATPSGNVRFYKGSMQLVSVPLSGGIASYSTTLPIGTYTIKATYQGDAHYTLVTAPTISQAVVSTDTTTSITSSPNPSTNGGAVTFSAAVSPVSPGSGTIGAGSVRFKDGAKFLGSSSVVNGLAGIVIETLSPGNHSITATYTGSTYANPSTSFTLIQTVQH